MADEQLTKRFLALQQDLKKTLEKLPKGVNSWFDGRVRAFKKCAKESERFLNLKPTDDLAQIHRLENHLQALKRFYVET